MSFHPDKGPLQIGSRFLDKYEIEGQVGRGGQAWVYYGKHLFTGRQVAIKVIHSQYGVTQEMMVRGKSEARALGKLDHPNIVTMHDAGVTDDGLFYIVMELLRGRTFRAVLAAHGRLEVEEVLRLAIQAGEAVHSAHEVQMIHRDLKPDNIYLTRDNRLKVLDFGIAKMLDEIGFTTRKDIVAGTLLYMSPEQAQGAPLTPRSDICALGLMMFEALIGKHPSLLIFERDLAERNEPPRRPTIADIPPIQVNRMPPMLSELDASIPIYVAQMVQRAIAKVAKQRFNTMADFVSAMRLCLETYLRDVPVERRRSTQRDLSLAGTRAPETSPALPVVTPKVESPRQDLPETNAAVTEGVKRVQTSRDLNPPAAILTTAPLGTFAPADPRPLEATPKTPDVTPPRHEAEGRDTLPESPRASAILKPVTPPPVAVAPRGADRGSARKRSAANAVRIAAVVGALFGATLGTAAAEAYFARRHHATASAALAATGTSEHSTTTSAPLAGVAPPPAESSFVHAPPPSPIDSAQAAPTAASIVKPPLAVPSASHGPASPRRPPSPNKPAASSDQVILHVGSGLGSEPPAKPSGKKGDLW